MSFLDKMRGFVKKHDVEGKAERLAGGIQRVGRGAGRIVVAGGRGAITAAGKFQSWQDKRAVEGLHRERVMYERAKIAHKFKTKDFRGPIGMGRSAPRRAAPSQRGGNANYYRRLYEDRVKRDLGIERDADRYDRG